MFPGTSLVCAGAAAEKGEPMPERAQGGRKSHRWLNVVWMIALVVAAVLGALGRDYLLVLQAALFGTFMWLSIRGYPNAERPAARLLFFTVALAIAAVLIYRVLFVHGPSM